MSAISQPFRAIWLWAPLALAGCAGTPETRHEPAAAAEFYTVTAELALARGESRIGALQYAAAADSKPDPGLCQRAVEVATDALQPSLVARVARRWIAVEPDSAEAQRAAARAALALYRIDDAAAHYHQFLAGAPNIDARIVEMEADLTTDENVFGARALADQLVLQFPTSWEAMRVQGIAALRADDPASAARSLTLALAAEPREGNAGVPAEGAAETHRELEQTLWRAEILAGDSAVPLAEAKAQLEREDTPENRFAFAVLLMSAQRFREASEQLEVLARKQETQAGAWRVLGLLEFQQGHLEEAAARFRSVLRTGRFADDAYYYLGVIADRNGDPDGALRLYAQVQHGDNVLQALLRATVLLYAHGAPESAEDLMNRLMQEEPQRLPEILNARVRMYADAGEMDRAEELLEKGLTEYPDSVELRYAQAALYEDQGRVNQALQALTAVLSSRPDDPAALNALGFTLADHRKSLVKARRRIERAHAAAPHNAAILDSLGWVLFRQGRDREALPFLSEAYADDHGGDIAAHLGEVLWGEGQTAEAQRIWSEASVIDADNRLLRATRKRLQAAN